MRQNNQKKRPSQDKITTSHDKTGEDLTSKTRQPQDTAAIRQVENKPIPSQAKTRQDLTKQDRDKIKQNKTVKTTQHNTKQNS